MLRTVKTHEDWSDFITWIAGRTYVAVDTETSGHSLYDPRFRIRLLQIGSTREAWVLPWHVWGPPAAMVLQEFSGTVVMHNCAYDREALRLAGWEIPWTKIADTMLALRIAQPDQSAALKEASNRLISPRASGPQKDLKDAFRKNGWTWETVPLDFPPYVYYAALDVILTSRLWEHPKVQAVVSTPIWRLEMDVRAVSSQMTATGMRIDTDACQDAATRMRNGADSLRAKIEHEHGITVTSNAQLARTLLSLPESRPLLTKRTEAGAVSVDKEVLGAIVAAVPGSDAAVLAQAALDVRYAEKLAANYFEKFLELADPRGMVHADINTMAARTSRQSIRQPALQTLPKDGSAEVRAVVVPRQPGDVLVSSDFEQIEQRLIAAASQDENLIEAFRTADATGGDYFAEMGKTVYSDPAFTKEDPRRKVVKAVCVPLDVPILTQRGWLRHDEVRVGDSTIGYNWQTEMCEWTEILDVVHPGTQPVVEISNRILSMRATADHRWVVDHRNHSHGKDIVVRRYETTAGLGREDRILLTAPFDGPGYDISDDEAELLGWLLTDGTLTVSPATGRTSQAGGRRRGVTARIRQKKHAARVKDLLGRLGHHKDPHTSDAVSGYYVWTLPAPMVRDLLLRTGLMDRPRAIVFATGLSADQRTRILEAAHLADGMGALCKTDPWTVDLFEALIYLSGQRPQTVWRDADSSAWQRKPIANVHTRNSGVTGQRLRREIVGEEPVWCVTTGLGTWTMRQDDSVVLTGNCYASAYGAGPAKIAQTAKIPEAEARAVRDSILARFPGMSVLMRQLEESVKESGTVRTMMGRTLVVDEPYKGLNAYIQGSAADLFKRQVVDMARAGLDRYMVVPVHDEVLFSFPREDAAELSEVVNETMPITDTSVPIPAEASGFQRAWGIPDDE